VQRLVLLALPLLVLVGCGRYYEALTFSHDQAVSGVDGPYRAILVGGPPPTGEQSAAQRRAADFCQNGLGTPSGLASAALTGIVATAIVGVGFDLITDALADSVEDLERRSKRTAALTVNASSLDFGARDLAGHCLYLERTRLVGPADQPVFQTAMEATPIGDGFIWKPRGARMSQARAITARGGEIVVDIALNTAVVAQVNGRNQLVSLGDAAIQVRLRPAGANQQPYAVAASEMADPGLLPAPSVLPGQRVTGILTVTITETGSGSQLFAKALESAKDNLAALRGYATSYAQTFAAAGRL